MSWVRNVSRAAFAFRALPLSCIAAAATSIVVFLTINSGVDSSGDKVEALMVVAGLAPLRTVWSAIIAVTVVLPIAQVLHAATGRWDRPWVFGLSGILALPLAVVMFVFVSKVFPGNERPTWDQLNFMAQNPARFAPILAGLGVGGVVFSIGFARNQHSSSIPNEGFSLRYSAE